MLAPCVRRGEVGGTPVGRTEHSSALGERGVQKRLTALASLTPLRGDALLDIGCGDGTYTRRLADGFARVEAIDPEPGRLGVFRDRGLDGDVRLHEMYAEALAFPADTFDVVTAIEVLEHVSDVERTLAEVHRVLRPGGRFGLTTPNRLFPIESHGFQIRDRWYPPHLAPFLTWVAPLHRRVSDSRAFGYTELAAALRRARLRIVGATVLMPPFDRSKVGQHLRIAADWIETTRLGRFGLTHVIVAEKVEDAAGNW